MSLLKKNFEIQFTYNAKPNINIFTVLIPAILKTVILESLNFENENAILAPTINKNQGITKSASFRPFQGSWSISAKLPKFISLFYKFIYPLHCQLIS